MRYRWLRFCRCHVSSFHCASPSTTDVFMPSHHGCMQWLNVQVIGVLFFGVCIQFDSVIDSPFFIAKFYPGGAAGTEKRSTVSALSGSECLLTAATSLWLLHVLYSLVLRPWLVVLFGRISIAAIYILTVAPCSLLITERLLYPRPL